MKFFNKKEKDIVIDLTQEDIVIDLDWESNIGPILIPDSTVHMVRNTIEPTEPPKYSGLKPDG